MAEFSHSPPLSDLASAIATPINANPTLYGITVANNAVTVSDEPALIAQIKKTLSTCTSGSSAGMPTYPGSLDDLATKIATAIKDDLAGAGFGVGSGNPPGPTSNLTTLTTFINDNVLTPECPKAVQPPPEPDNSKIPNDIRESVAIANMKSVAEQPAMLSSLSFANLATNDNLSQQNAVSFQQAMNQLTVTVTAKGVNRVSNLGTLEGISITKVMTSNDTARLIPELRAVITARSQVERTK